MAGGNVARAEVCASCATQRPADECCASQFVGAGAAAGCGRASVADLLVAAQLMSTAAAGVFEAKKTQKMVQLQLLCAEGS